MEGTGAEGRAGVVDRRTLAERLLAAQVVDGGAEGPVGSGASEKENGVGCTVEGRHGRMCHCDHRRSMELFDERVHTQSGIPVDPRFIRRGCNGDARVPDRACRRGTRML
jgi:hypothetical protein